MPKPVSSAGAPKAIGPYSQAIEARGARTLWLSGQIPLDPATGELVAGDVAAQTERVMENLGAVLAAGGAGFHARATVQVAALPRGARVEIDAVAVLG